MISNCNIVSSPDPLLVHCPTYNNLRPCKNTEGIKAMARATLAIGHTRRMPMGPEANGGPKFLGGALKIVAKISSRSFASNQKLSKNAVLNYIIQID